MDKELVLTFLAWCSFGALVGSWITSQRGRTALIALAIATVGTGAMVYPDLTAYWWVGLLAAIGIVLVRRELRRRAWLAVRLGYNILIKSNTYVDRVRTLTSDEWKDWTVDLVKQKETLEKDNEDLMRIIRDLAMEHKRAYKIVRDAMEAQIEEDGTETGVRVMRIAAVTESVSWVDMGYGTTLMDPYAHGVTFDRPEIIDEEGRSLSYTIYEDQPKSKRLLIFLRERLTVGGGEQTIQVFQRAPRVWADLINRLEDFGTYEPQNTVEEFIMTRRVPPSLRIIGFHVSPEVGNPAIAEDQLSATWSATGLEPGKTYRYTIRCARVR